MTNKLFVTKLSYKTTDESLAAHFEPYGALIWCQVVKDRVTGASRRYAFVQFEKDEDSEKALHELKDSTVDGCRIAVERSHQGAGLASSSSRASRNGGGDEETRTRRGRSPTPRKNSESPNRNKRRAGSPQDNNNNDDSNHNNHNNKSRSNSNSRGRSESPVSRSPSEERRKKEAAESAAEVECCVEEEEERRGSGGGGGCSKSKQHEEKLREGKEVRLFVGGLPDDVHEDDLMKLFEDSEPVDAFVCRDKEPPCGFITLRNEQALIDKAFEKNNIYFKDSRWRMLVKDAKPPRPKHQENGGESSPSTTTRRKRSASCEDDRGRRRGGGAGGSSRSRDRSRGRGGRDVRLFVGGLPSGVTEDQLLNLFKKYDATDVFIPRDRQTKAPYYGFVAIRDQGDNVDKALKLDGEKFEEGSEDRLTVSYSKPRRQDLPPRRRSPSPYHRRRSPSPRGRYRRRSYSRGRSRSRSRDRRGGGRRSRSRSRGGGRGRSRSRSRGGRHYYRDDDDDRRRGRSRDHERGGRGRHYRSHSRSRSRGRY